MSSGKGKKKTIPLYIVVTPSNMSESILTTINCDEDISKTLLNVTSPVLFVSNSWENFQTQGMYISFHVFRPDADVIISSLVAEEFLENSTSASPILVKQQQLDVNKMFCRR